MLTAIIVLLVLLVLRVEGLHRRMDAPLARMRELRSATNRLEKAVQENK